MKVYCIFSEYEHDAMTFHILEQIFSTEGKARDYLERIHKEYLDIKEWEVREE